MSRVLVLGATSLVGSHFVAARPFPLTAAGRTDPGSAGVEVDDFRRLDLRDPAAVGRLVGSDRWRAVVNFAGATDVDAVETERALPEPERALSWEVNVVAAETLARSSADSGIPFLTLSTDFVFDGAEGPYDEDALPAADAALLNWYGWTKAEGERRVLRAHPRATIVRISYPFRSQFTRKMDFGRRMVEWERRQAFPPLYDDQVITPTWIPDVTRTIEELLVRDVTGVVHVASPRPTTPWEFGSEVARQLRGGAPSLPRGSLAEANRSSLRARRPLHGGLRCRRALDLNVTLTDWRDGIGMLLAEAAR